MDNYTIFLDIRKSKGRQASKKFYNKCSENSRPQIVFRTDIFRKLTLGVPERMGRNRQNSHTRAQSNSAASQLRLIESVCSASKAKWRLGNSRARETSEKRERGMIGTSVERERGMMGSLYVQMLTVRTFILGTSLPIGCRRRLVFIERARKTRFSLLSRARPRNFSLFTRKRIGACNTGQPIFRPTSIFSQRYLDIIKQKGYQN